MLVALFPKVASFALTAQPLRTTYLLPFSHDTPNSWRPRLNHLPKTTPDPSYSRRIHRQYLLPPLSSLPLSPSQNIRSSPTPSSHVDPPLPIPLSSWTLLGERFCSGTKKRPLRILCSQLFTFRRTLRYSMCSPLALPPEHMTHTNYFQG